MQLPNSYSRIPSAPYVKQGLVFVLLVCGLVFALESVRRAQGYRPSVADSKWFWSHLRHQVYGDNVLLLLGASRAQINTHPQVLKKGFANKRVVNLTIDGTSPIRILEDLAADEGFRGDVILAIAEYQFAPEQQQKADAWIEHYHTQYVQPESIDEIIDLRVKLALQSRMAIFSPHLNLARLARSGLNPPKLFLHMDAERYRPAHYRERLTEKQRKARYEARARGRRSIFVTDSDAQQEAFLQVVRQQLKPAAERLAQRGSRLFFVRMPTTGRYGEMDEEQYPRSRYWDLIAHETGVPTLYFRDNPTMAAMECPDGSHLDVSDTQAFTEALVSEVRIAWAGDGPHDPQQKIVAPTP